MLMKLNQVINPFETGIFQMFHQLEPDIEWLDADNVQQLDEEFILLHSGEKYLSPLVKRMIRKQADGTVTNWVEEVARIILISNKDNWNKIYNVYFKADYSPLENYDMVENENVQSDVHNEITNESGVHGFNSSESVPKDKVVTSSDTSGDFDKNHRELTRHGNIGVTTSQQMLQSELDLRKLNFYRSIMDVIDKYMCLKIY